MCERYDAWLLLDDAHGFGVLGEHGAGTLSHFGLRSERVIYMGTLGKAAGVFGAFVAADATIIDYLVNRARSYIYTTAMPALLAAALLESLRILRTEDWRRAHLSRLIADAEEGRRSRLRNTACVADARFSRSCSVGCRCACARLAGARCSEGSSCPAIRPPTVPQGSARLRISLSAAHQVEDVERLLGALRESAR